MGVEITSSLTNAEAGTAIFYIGSREAAEKKAADIEGFGGKAMICQADVRDESLLKNAVGKVVKEWGQIEICLMHPV